MRGQVFAREAPSHSHSRRAEPARATAPEHPWRYDAPVHNVPVWDDGNWQGLSPLESDMSADVCVVGLGGSGLAAVLESLELGRSVVGIDAGSVAGGAAGRNGGFLLCGTSSFHHDAVEAIGRARAVALDSLTRAELSRMLSESPSFARRVGSLRIATTDDDALDCQRQLEAMRADGLPVETYEGPEGRGLLFPDDATFNPLRRCRSLATRAIEQGAHLYEHSTAVRLSAHEVRTARGRVRCAGVIVAVDGGLERVLPELVGHVQTARLQMLATAPTDEVHVPRPVYLRYGYEYYQQTSDGRIALGGFRDLGGAGEWTASTEPSAIVQARLEQFLREGLGVHAPITHRWAASVGYTFGVLPVFEQVRDGVWALGGYRGTGNLIGSVLGRAAAQQLALGASPLSAPFETN